MDTILKQLHLNKSAGPDGLLPIFFKFGRLYLSELFCNLFNLSIFTRTVPVDWKLVNVIPIFKGAPKPKEHGSSYRPVSLTPIISKIMEKLIRLMNFFEDSNILGNDQFGFRPARSSELMLSKVHHHFIFLGLK